MDVGTVKAIGEYIVQPILEFIGLVLFLWWIFSN
jgi:hypothetical protein